MKHLRKYRLFCALLTLTIIVSGSLSTALSERESTVITDEYQLQILQDGTAEITKCLANGSELIIPESIEGYQISGLADYAISTSSYESISIPKTLINYVGNPFTWCYKLQIINVPSDHPTLSVIDNVLFSKDGKRLVCYPRTLDQAEYSIPNGVEVIGEWAFYGNESLNTIVLPESATTIEDAAFVNCKRLKSINIPENVVVVGSRPFGSCTSLANIEVSGKNTHFEVIDGMLIDNDKKRLINVLLGTRNSSYSIPEGITTIGVGAFSEDKSGFDTDGDIKSIVIPDSVTTIESSAFATCTGLEKITIPDSVTKLESGAFTWCAGLKTVKLPSSLTEIPDTCFWGCSGLQKLEIPLTVTSIGKGAFYYCISLERIDLPDSITEINKNAFERCENLVSIRIPKEVNVIEEYTFVGCLKLSRIELHEGITHIKEYAFSGCALNQVTLPESVIELGECAFSGNSMVTIAIPNNLLSIGNRAFLECENLKSIIVTPEHPVYATIDGTLFNKMEKSLLCYPIGKEESTYQIPDGIVIIGDGAFSRSTHLADIIIPNSVKRIGKESFYSCEKLAALILPEGLESIGDRAFSKCIGLAAINLPDSINNIGGNAFSWCENLSITVSRNSYSAEYCQKNKLNYTYPDANDWLNSP